MGRAAGGVTEFDSSNSVSLHNQASRILNFNATRYRTVTMGVRVVVLVVFTILLVCGPVWGGADAVAAAAGSPRHGALMRVSRIRVARPLLSHGPAISGNVGREAPLAGTGERLAAQFARRPRAHFSVSPASMTYRGGRVLLRWSASNAKRCTLRSSPAFWSGPNPSRVRCRGRLVGTLPAVDKRFGWKFTFTATNKKGKAVGRRTFAIQPPPFTISSNWAGYIVPSSSLITETSGRFVVPTLNCTHTSDGLETTWVGIGGAGTGTGDLLQTGVQSYCQGGVEVADAAWWELVPPLPEQNFNSMSVSPGDAIEAAIFRNSDESWTTRLDDLTTGISGVMTTGDGYGTILDSNPTVWRNEESTAVPSSYAGGYTAEWIAEAPTDASTNTIVPLADFGTIAFTGLTTSLPSWALTNSEQSGIGDTNGFLYAAPSTPSGNGFSVTFTG
jgi:hypothetical protein